MKSAVWFAVPVIFGSAAYGVTFTAPPLSLAQDATAPAPEPPSQPAEEADLGYGVTGNWAGARDALHKNHIDVGGSVLLDVSKVLRGGLDTEAWPISYLLDLHVTIDMDGFGLRGGTFFTNFQSHDQSQNGDTAVGDIQVFDNSYAPRYTQIAQLWYRQNVGNFRIKVGKIDANADAGKPGESATDCFSLMEHGLDFIQSAAAFTPTIFAMPTFPEGAPGAEIFYRAPVEISGSNLDHWYAGVGGFYSNMHQTLLNLSGHPEKGFSAAGGMFVIGEVGARWTAMGDAYAPGHVAIGAWYHNGEFPRVEGIGANRGSGGTYFLFDTSIYHDEQPGRVRDVGYFFEAGYADRTTSSMDTNLIFGLSASGMIGARPADTTGVMLSWVHLTQPGLPHAYELASELFYKVQLTSWASLKPSIAYIASPSGTAPDALVATVRAEIDF